MRLALLIAVLATSPAHAEEACAELAVEDLGAYKAKYCATAECPGRKLEITAAKGGPNLYETSKGLVGARIVSINLAGGTLTVVSESCDALAEPSTSTETLAFDDKTKKFVRKGLTTQNPYREQQKKVFDLLAAGNLCEARKILADIGTMPNGHDDITAEYVGPLLKAVRAKNDVKTAKEFFLHPGGEEACPKTLAPEPTCVGGFEPCRDLKDFVYDTQNQSDWVTQEHVDLMLDLVGIIQKSGDNQLAVALYRELQRTREARAWLAYGEALSAVGEHLVAESVFAEYEAIEKKAPPALEVARKRPKQAEYKSLEEVPADVLKIDRDSLFNPDEIVFRVKEPARIAGKPCHPGRAVARREDGRGAWAVAFCPGKR